MPRVAPENRRSVSSATCLADPLAVQKRSDAEHLAHPGPSDGTLVADHDHFARPVVARPHCRGRVLLALEDAGEALDVSDLRPAI